MNTDVLGLGEICGEEEVYNKCGKCGCIITDDYAMPIFEGEYLCDECFEDSEHLQ